jgi:CubicO group peptidase (beta-lactamase class C family)
MKRKDNEVIYPKYSWIVKKNDGKSYNIFDSILPFIVNKMNTTGLMVIQHGEVIFEYGDIEELSYIASCRKSVLAMLYGKYVENGTINLNSTMEELEVDDIQGLLPIEKKATIRDLITARSGIYHPRSNGGDSTANAPERGSKKPGEYFLYNNWDFNALGSIFEKLTGLSIFDALENDIAIPIGMEDFDKNKQEMCGDESKSIHMAYHMWFSTRDMARLGYLMLRNGNWCGKQIIPKQWIKEVLQISTTRENMNLKMDREGDFSYGYMWWLFDNPRLHKAYDDAYTAWGYFGQYITVIPKLDLVIAHKTKYDYLRETRNYHLLLDKIVKGLYSHDNFDLEEAERTELGLYDKYVGEYKSNKNNPNLKISREGNILYATTERRGKYKLCLCSKHLYYNENDKKWIFGFEVNKENGIDLTVTYDSYMEELKKIK